MSNLIDSWVKIALQCNSSGDETARMCIYLSSVQVIGEFLKKKKKTPVWEDIDGHFADKNI